MKKVQGPRLTFARLLTIVFAGIAIFMVINLGQGWLTCQSALRERQDKLAIVRAEQARRDSLVQLWAAAETPGFVARTIREELGWSERAEGSAILQYQDWPPAQSATAAPGSQPADAPPHWLDWFSAFLLP